MQDSELRTCKDTLERERDGLGCLSARGRDSCQEHERARDLCIEVHVFERYLAGDIAVRHKLVFMGNCVHSEGRDGFGLSNHTSLDDDVWQVGHGFAVSSPAVLRE